MRFLGKLKPARVGELYKRVADEINTTFAIESTVELSFEKAMTPEIIEKYNAKTTGEKYILNPNKGQGVMQAQPCTTYDFIVINSLRKVRFTMAVLLAV